MADKRAIPGWRVVLAFLIATFVFINGFLIGYTVSYFKYRDLVNQQEAVSYELLSLDLSSAFLSSCEAGVFSSISAELDDMGRTMGLLEERMGKFDPQVIEQKKRYTLLEVQHFLNVKKYKESCNNNITTLLFFYSNSKTYQDASEKTGFILSTIKDQNPGDVMIYSLDYDLDINIIALLKKVYNIKSPNTVVINEKTNLSNVQNIGEIEKYL